MNELGTCNTQLEKLSTGINIISQAMDYLRVGPLSSEMQWSTIERRFSYLECSKVNHFGRWYVDFPGDALELVRMVESMDGIINFFKHTRWTRCDFAYDVLGVDIEKLPQPGTTILNGGDVETVYSHHLKLRGNYAVFARAYDALKAGHDVPQGTIRFEVEFKRRLPDVIRNSDDVLKAGFSCAAFHIARIYGIVLPVETFTELKPPKRLVQHGREKFYQRFGKAILLDVATMGQNDFSEWLKLCIARGEDENRNS